jgi:hypothetical protein
MALAPAHAAKSASGREPHHEKGRESVTTRLTANHARIGMAVALALAIGVLAGCSTSADQNAGADSSSADATASANASATAKGAATVALSTLSTAAPDGVVLLARTLVAISATSPPVWDFLIGSPKTNAVFNVVVVGGHGKFQTAGTVTFKPSQWAKVPRLTAWTMDSDVAHEKAVAAFPEAAGAAYNAGMLAYVPVSANDPAAKPLRWTIGFDPATMTNSATSTVLVDAATGAATLAK